MAMTNTSEHRVNALVGLSERIYPAIDTVVGGETRARRILRLGIQVAAHTLESATRYPFVAGDYYHALLLNELETGGIHYDDFRAWPTYQKYIKNLPRPQPSAILDSKLDAFVCAYADVERRTIGTNGHYETDANHAVHLGALALPYACQYYPDLDPSKITLYSLLHDSPEAYAGDTPSLGMSEATIKSKNAKEAAALERIVTEFGGSFPQLVKLIERYEELDDDEAKFVKTFDKLDPSFTHLANAGLALRKYHQFNSGLEFLDVVHQTTVRMRPYAEDFPELMYDRLRLLERVAQVTPWHQKVPA